MKESLRKSLESIKIERLLKEIVFSESPMATLFPKGPLLEAQAEAISPKGAEFPL